MKRSVLATTSVIVAGAVLMILAEGCSSRSPQTSSTPAPPSFTDDAQVAMFCGAGETYVPAAMNAKLRYYPDFANAIGLTKVTDCSTGHAFMARYARYYVGHPGFDDHQPIRRLTARPGPPPNTPAPSLERYKIAGGTPVQQPPEVAISGGQGSVGCSGTFIAKNWILTAAHCMAIDPQIPVGGGAPRNPAYNTNFVAIDAGDAGFPLFSQLNVYATWTVDWANANGNAIPPNGTPDNPNVAVELKASAYQYLDTRWTGTSAELTGGLDKWDMALLYFSVVDDPMLPPSPDNGAALPIGIEPPSSSDIVFFYGWGLPSDRLELGVATGSYIALTPPWLETLIPSGAQLTCKGDSGGAAGRLINSGTVGVPQIAAVGVLQAGGSTATGCSTSGGTEFWTRTDLETDFINQTIQLWEPNFSCRPQLNSDTGNFDYAECWGSPCQLDTDCPSGDYCSQSPQTTLNTGSCPVCSTGDCSCVSGQCLPLQTFPLDNQACVSDQDCGGEAPICVVPDDAAIGTCQGLPDGGDDGPSE